MQLKDLKVRSFNSPLLITGSPRSGTSWVHNVLSNCKQCYGVYEPLHPRHCNPPKWSQKPDMPPGPMINDVIQQKPKWDNYLSSLLSGQLDTHWTRQDHLRTPQAVQKIAILERIYYFYFHHRAILSAKRNAHRKLIIKLVRANLIIQWLLDNYDVRVIHIIRDPYENIASRVRLGFPDSLDLCIQSIPSLNLNDEQITLLKDATDPIDRAAVLWCIENAHIVKIKSDRFVFFKYEDLNKDTLRCFGEMFEFSSIEASQYALKQVNRRVSSPKKENKALIKPWYSPLKEADAIRVREIVDIFGMMEFVNS